MIHLIASAIPSASPLPPSYGGGYNGPYAFIFGILAVIAVILYAIGWANEKWRKYSIGITVVVAAVIVIWLLSLFGQHGDGTTNPSPSPTVTVSSHR
jgi:type IV secretory pathway TrbL component